MAFCSQNSKIVLTFINTALIMNKLLLSLLLAISLLQSSCIAQEESHKRERSNFHELVKMQAFFQKENLSMGDTVIMEVHITNISDTTVVIYKNAVLAIERNAYPKAFGESLNIIPLPKTLLQDNRIMRGEELMFEILVPIEAPVFYSGKLKGLFLKYIKPHNKKIDILECPLEEIIVL